MHVWRVTVGAAVVAAVLTQILHELAHAAAMWLFGAGVEVVQLFAVSPRAEVGVWGEMIIAGAAVPLTIVVGVLATAAFYRPVWQGRAVGRLLTYYVAGMMLMSGFGYLMVDALLYSPDAPFFPDWQRVIHLLGGGWEVRAPILALGVAGVLALFFWLPAAGLRFVSDPTAATTRAKEMRGVALVPYLVVCTVFTLLGLAHPLGVVGVVIVGFQYWFGYVPLLWATFIGGLWTDVRQPHADATPLTSDFPPGWLLILVIGGTLLALVLTPGLRL